MPQLIPRSRCTALLGLLIGAGCSGSETPSSPGADASFASGDGGALGVAGSSSGTGGVTSGNGGTSGTGNSVGSGGKSNNSGGTSSSVSTGGKSNNSGGAASAGTGGKSNNSGGFVNTGGKSNSVGTGGSASVGSGGTSGSCTPTVASLPQIGGCNVFTADSPWNTDIHCAPLHPRAAEFHAAFDVDPKHRAVHLDLGSTETFYGIPSAVVPANQATVSITYGVEGENYMDQSDLGPFPIPLDARIEGEDGTTDPTDGDRHVIVVQQGTCLLFELYKAVRTTSPAGFRCGSSAKWDLNVNGKRTAGWTSADAAGLPIFPGLLRYAEIQAGAIHHALRVTSPTAQIAYIPPASHLGTASDATMPPYGLRWRLKAGFSEAGYSAEAKVLIAALKTYGLIYADQGTAWYISGSSDPGLANLIDEIHGTRPIPSSAFEAVYTGDTVCGWGAAGACN